MFFTRTDHFSYADFFHTNGGSRCRKIHIINKGYQQHQQANHNKHIDPADASIVA